MAEQEDFMAQLLRLRDRALLGSHPGTGLRLIERDGLSGHVVPVTCCPPARRYRCAARA